MKVILRSDVPNLGHAGDLVKVRPGFARNYLVPKGLAVTATRASLRAMEHERRQIALRERNRLRDLQKTAAKLQNVSLTVAKEVGEADKLYGSVTTIDLQRALEAEGIDLDRRLIVLEEPIKNLGVYEVPVKLHRDIDAKLKIWVVKA